MYALSHDSKRYNFIVPLWKLVCNVNEPLYVALFVARYVCRIRITLIDSLINQLHASIIASSCLVYRT